VGSPQAEGPSHSLPEYDDAPGCILSMANVGQKFGQSKCLVGKTSEVCFSMYFIELIKILKSDC
jgi:hypothetical protein